jgi:glycosyltransferase involved in cell wall biosynthesis
MSLINGSVANLESAIFDPNSGENSECLYSVVIPVYFEEECISRCVAEVVKQLEAAGLKFEIIFVDDYSADRTVEILKAAAEHDSRLKIVELAFNHGKQGALTAGISYAKGDRIILMDPDLQDSPDEIVRFIKKIDEGYDIVYGIRDQLKGSLISGLFSRLFWLLLNRLTGLKVPSGLAVMRMFNGDFRRKFLEYREASRFIEGIFLHIGMRQGQLTIKHCERLEGESKFTFSRKLQMATTATLDFSSIPLILAVRVGVVLVGLGFLVAIGLIVARLFFMEFQLGWPSLVVTMIIGFGLQILVTGIVGLYVGRTYQESKRRPLFSVNTVTNIETPDLVF